MLLLSWLSPCFGCSAWFLVSDTMFTQGDRVVWTALGSCGATVSNQSFVTSFSVRIKVFLWWCRDPVWTGSTPVELLTGRHWESDEFPKFAFSGVSGNTFRMEVVITCIENYTNWLWVSGSDGVVVYIGFLPQLYGIPEHDPQFCTHTDNLW